MTLEFDWFDKKDKKYCCVPPGDNQCSVDQDKDRWGNEIYNGDNGNPGLSAPKYLDVDSKSVSGSVILLYRHMVGNTARGNRRSSAVILPCCLMRSVVVRKALTKKSFFSSTILFGNC